MQKLAEAYADLPRWIRMPLWRVWHNMIAWWERREVAMTLMNYGYAPLDGAPTPVLEPRDEDERYAIQLYDATARGATVEGKDLLEVGSGRGGGASYISRYLRPRRYVGLDISRKCIRFCNRYHSAPNLSFVQGHAGAFPFEPESFDVVLSVEASRGFGSLAGFLGEVRRVLRPGGKLLLTDLRWSERVADLRATLEECRFRIREEIEITANVLKALRADSSRRVGLIERKAPRLFHNTFAEFAAVEGSPRFSLFATGKMQYWRFVLEPQP